MLCIHVSAYNYTYKYIRLKGFKQRVREGGNKKSSWHVSSFVLISIGNDLIEFFRDFGLEITISNSNYIQAKQLKGFRKLCVLLYFWHFVLNLFSLISFSSLPLFLFSNPIHKTLLCNLPMFEVYLIAMKV